MTKVVRGKKNNTKQKKNTKHQQQDTVRDGAHSENKVKHLCISKVAVFYVILGKMVQRAH